MIETITTTGVRQLIKTVYDPNGFTFWVDVVIEYAHSDSPATDEIIPLAVDTKYSFEKPQSFWVKGTAGTKIFISPFDK